jgi:uncharacterized surface protein with fasciclin (FAS1) repeats
MRKIATGIAAASALALAMSTAGPASADDHLGTTPLAAVLTADGNKFDRNKNDYDIVTEAVLAVLAEKPSSPVGLLTDGEAALTAFVPNDEAFRKLVKDLTGKTYKRERTVFNKVAGLGIDTVEAVLLYHVVPGKTIDAATAVKADRVGLGTANGDTFMVQVRGNGSLIKLSDRDYNSRNPRVNVADVNVGNVQIAHGIDRVLRPMDLPPTKR